MIFNREPVLWLTATQALIACGVGFGLKVTTEQMALILAASAAVLGLIARQVVTPNAKLAAPPAPGAGTGLMLGAIFVLALAGLLFAPQAHAIDFMKRASVGLTGGALWVEPDSGANSSVGVNAGPYLTYNLVEHLTLGAAYERELTHNMGTFRLAAATPLVMVGRSRVYARLEYVDRHGPGFAWVENSKSWQIGLQLSAPLLSKTRADDATKKQTVVWAVGGGALDPQEDVNPITTWNVAARWQIKGPSGGAE